MAGTSSREITFREAISEALHDEMERDPRVFLMGEDLQVFYGGGPLKVTPAEMFYKKFGADRVRDTPISEAAFIGAGVGAAVTGMRPIVELMFVDFFGVCFDQIYNNAAKFRYMFGGQASVPLVIRTTFGAGFSFGATHSQSLYSVFAHMPGLKVVIPSTPYDAKGLLISAMRGQDPVVFFEHKGLYPLKGLVPRDDYLVPLGKADVKREGRDVTIVATGMMVHKAMKAAEILKKDGIDLEILDPRSLVPLDSKRILESVEKTSRIIVVDEDYRFCGFAAEVSALVAENGFDLLDAPIKRVTTPNVPIPFAPVLEQYVMPDENKIIQAVKEIV